MKLYRNNKVYVNYKDLLFLINAGFDIPKEVKKDFPISYDFVDEYDFYEFSSDEAKSFFRVLEWIPEYNRFQNKDINYLQNYFIKNLQEIHKIYNRYCKALLKNDMEKANELRYYYSLLVYKDNSIKDIIDYKKGILKLDFPKKEKRDKDEKYRKFLMDMLILNNK